ncbi:MAG: MTH865 family protein [Halobacteria archaeon]|nr:MTH865 family protein [Halobacteria archaeon]
MADLSEDEEEELREQFVDAFEGADYPVNSPMDLVPALPEGPSTEFSVGEFSMTAMELNTQAGGQQDFPYESVDDLVDDIMSGLRDEDYI